MNIPVRELGFSKLVIVRTLGNGGVVRRPIEVEHIPSEHKATRFWFIAGRVTGVAEWGKA